MSRARFAVVVAVALVACKSKDGPKDERYAELRAKLDQVAATPRGAPFVDLGQSDATFLVGRTKAEIQANLGVTPLCYGFMGDPPCPPGAGWDYFFCHTPPGYRGGCSTLVIEFEGETCSKVHWEYGK